MTLKDVIRIANELLKQVGVFRKRSFFLDGIKSCDEQDDENNWTDSDELKNDIEVACIDSLNSAVAAKRPGLQITTSYLTKKNLGSNCYSRYLSYCTERGGGNQSQEASIVIYNQEDRLCFKRFLLAKELAHLYTNTVSDKDVNRKLLAALLQEKALDGTRFIDNSDAELTPEAVGFYLAIEYLVPYKLRRNIELIKEQLGQTNNWAIARGFLVPQFLIRHIREDRFRNNPADNPRCNYLTLSNQIHREVIGERI